MMYVPANASASVTTASKPATNVEVSTVAYRISNPASVANRLTITWKVCREKPSISTPRPISDKPAQIWAGSMAGTHSCKAGASDTDEITISSAASPRNNCSVGQPCSVSGNAALPTRDKPSTAAAIQPATSLITARSSGQDSVTSTNAPRYS